MRLCVRHLGKGEEKMSWALVTGGAKKLGAALSFALAEHHPVVIHYKESEQEALDVQKKILKKGGKAEIIRGDFSTKEGTFLFLEEYERRFSSTKILLCNASSYHFGSFLTTPSEEAVGLWHGNFFAPYLLSQKLAPSLKEAKGSILYLGVAGLTQILSDTRTSFYTLSKLSLLMLTKSLAKELAPSGVRVNMVSPGYLKGSVDLPKSESLLPMQRLGEADEIVRMVLFLLDEKNGYITGQNIEVAGGVRV